MGPVNDAWGAGWTPGYALPKMAEDLDLTTFWADEAKAAVAVPARHRPACATALAAALAAALRS